MAKRTCTIDGCDKPHRAKGYCGSHYNQAYLPNRHRTYTIRCAECGTEYESSRKQGQFCSLLCRDNAVYRAARERNAAEEVARRAARAALRAARDLAREATPPTFTPEPRTCTWCGTDYLAPMPHSAYCTERCAKRASRARRRAREHGAAGSYTWAEVVRLYLDLGRQCAYCARTVHLSRIEPDHVIPLSKGGANSITNVVPACKPCNSAKRDLMLPDWYRDRERRGLEARVLDPRLTHLTHTRPALSPAA